MARSWWGELHGGGDLFSHEAAIRPCYLASVCPRGERLSRAGGDLWGVTEGVTVRPSFRRPDLELVRNFGFRRLLDFSSSHRSDLFKITVGSSGLLGRGLSKMFSSPAGNRDTLLGGCVTE